EQAVFLFHELALSEYDDIQAFAQSNLMITSTQYQEGIKRLQDIPQTSPHYPEALGLMGNLHLVNDQFAAASEAFTQLIKLQPRNFKVRILAAQALIRDNRHTEANPHLDIILRALPDQAYANYLKAVVDYEAKDFVKAKEFADKAIANGYRAPQPRLIAGLSSFQLGLESQALHNFAAMGQYLDAFPPAKRLYVALQLKAGEPGIAKEALGSLPPTQEDLNLFATTAFNLARAGDNNAAAELIAKYESAGFKDVNTLLTMGQLKLNVAGQEHEGIRDLELALMMEPGDHQTRLILATSYLRQQQYDKVDQLADGWIKDPETAFMGHNLKAYADLLQLKPEDAKVHLAAAEVTGDNNPFTQLMLASVATFENDYPAAKVILDKLITSHPEYVPAITQSLIVGHRLGDATAEINRTKEQLAKNPQNYQLRLALARYLHNAKQVQEVITQLEPIDTAQQLPSVHWMILVDALVQRGNLAEASRLSQLWHQQNPEHIQATLLYAEVLRRNNNSTEAIRIIDRHLQRQPQNQQLLMSKLKLLTDSRQFDKAIDTVKQSPAEFQSLAEVQYLHGRNLMGLGQNSAALNLYLESYKNSPSAEAAMYITELYRQDVSLRQAINFIEAHLEKHETTHGLQIVYANLLMQTDVSKSVAIYKELVEQIPNNLVLLNNYAWMLIEQGEAEKALNYASQALKIDDKNPDILDTYGAALMRLNRHQDALSYFERSLTIRPEHDEVKLNYAEALILLNNKAKASQILNNVNSKDARLTQRKLTLSQQL
uniref:XrtA/PEP-CTERM system TPR-repeat protein PrsT n=1 Tax=Arsukibacterium sp. TaxID=1977258 RepID=UPI002FDA4D16